MWNLLIIAVIFAVFALNDDEITLIGTGIIIAGVTAWWRAYRKSSKSDAKRVPPLLESQRAVIPTRPRSTASDSQGVAPIKLDLEKQQLAVLRSAITATSGPRWLAAPETFAIGPHLIRLCFCFVGSVPTPGGLRVDPGYVIDTTLWVDWDSPPPDASSLVYLQYSAFLPGQRATFLEWHHHGRCDYSIGELGVNYYVRGIASRVAQCGATLRGEEAATLLAELSSVDTQFGDMDGVAGACARLQGMIQGITGSRSRGDSWWSRRSEAGSTAVDEPVVVSRHDPIPQSQGFKIPKIAEATPPRWIGPPERVRIAGREVTLSLCYLGTTEEGQGDGLDQLPSIDPREPVLWDGNPHVEPYYHNQSYSQFTNAARGAYLRWHDGGRVDPLLPVRYVEVYLDGIAAHLCVTNGVLPRDEVPLILQELNRLQQLYGHRSLEVPTRCREFSTLLSALDDELPAPTEPEAFVPNKPYWHVPHGFPIRLGRVLKTRAPISPTLALEWLMVARTSFRTPVTRASELFQVLFANRIEDEYPRGFVVPIPKSRLEFVVGYNSDRRVWRKVSTSLPDYSRLTAPLEKLRTVALATSEELEPYSRYLGREGMDNADTTEARLLLPQSVWPKDFVDAIDALVSRVGDGMLVLKANELLATLGTTSHPQVLSKAGWERLGKRLPKCGLALEWEAKGPPSGTVPSSAIDSRVAVFHFDSMAAAAATDSVDSHSAFDQATLALQLALFLVQNDVAPSRTRDTTLGGRDLARLHRAVMAQPLIDANNRRRLIARLRLRHASTVTLGPMRKAIAALSRASADRLLRMLGDVAHDDGEVSPAEIGALRKIFRAFGRNQDDVYALLHGAASSLTAAVSDQSAQSGVSSVKILPAAGGNAFQLDAARLAALEAETHAVQAMLAQIFVDDAAIDADPLESVKSAQSETSRDEDGRHGLPHARRVQSPVLAGLDEAHDGLARAMLGKQEHRRDELTNLANSFGLMLDGALERINEAAYDIWNAPFAEGEDPLELSPEAIQFRDTLAGHLPSSSAETSSIAP